MVEKVVSIRSHRLDLKSQICRRGPGSDCPCKTIPDRSGEANNAAFAVVGGRRSQLGVETVIIVGCGGLSCFW
jgi:hypothetical protein